jgi:drug/metabolite transporter (DMT)-like permease
VEAAEARAASPAQRADALSWFALLFLVVIWGSTFAGIRIAVDTIGPAWLVTGRLLGGALFLAIWIGGKRLIDKRPQTGPFAPVTWKAIWWFTFIGIVATAAPFLLYAMSAETTGSAVMAICNGATPFATVILAHFLVHDRLTVGRIVGVLLGFAGLVVLMLPEFGEEGGGNFAGIALAVVGAWLYAVGNVGTRMAPRVEPAMSSLIMVTSAGLGALVLALATEPFPASPSNASLIAMAMLALWPTAVAFFFYVWLIQRAGPVFVSFTTYLSPLWATLVGVTLMGEGLHWSMIGALALILMGVAVANRRPRAPIR